VVKFSVNSIGKRTREDLGKYRAVAHTVVRWREQNMHGGIFVPGIEENVCLVPVPALYFLVVSTVHGSFSMVSAPNGIQIFALNLPIFTSQ